LVKRYTEEAIEESEKIAAKMAYMTKNTPQYKSATALYDDIIMQWVEKLHRLGAVAKGLWLVDFDTGSGYLCWAYPEDRIEHFHSYEGGFKNRKKITRKSQLIESTRPHAPAE
jgi:hypothetical protein